MINKLLQYAKNENLELEIYSIKNDEISIEYLNKNLVNYKLQDIKEYKLKAIIDGAAVTTTVLDISNPEEVINTLKEARALTDELDNDSLAEQESINVENRNAIDIDILEVKNNLKNLNQELKEKYPSIFSIRSEYNFEKDEYQITNTNGVLLKDFNYHGYYNSDIVLKIEDQNLTCSKFVMAKIPDFEIFKNKLIDKIEDTLKKYNAKSTSTNKYNIILDNKSVYDILNNFALDFHTQNIRKNNSAFASKKDKKIFNKKITIVEDPTNKNLIGTRLFDSEGVKTYYKEIVKGGVFTTELYNKKYAEMDKIKSTGNSYGVRNLYIVPGDITKEELIKSMNDGVYIENLMGLHSGINHLTGDISIQCEGFIIKNGKKTKALNQIILSSNIFELFTNVKEIANDLEFFGSNGGAPSMLIENITIVGKEV